MSRAQRRAAAQANDARPLWCGKWAKAMSAGESFTKDEFEELPDVIYWVQQVVALVQGLLWGFIPLTGSIGLVSWGVTNSLFVFGYCTSFLDLDLESEWDTLALLKEASYRPLVSFARPGLSCTQQCMLNERASSCPIACGN